jgi:hypothetical protein
MTKFAVAGLAALVAGCAAGYGGHAGGPSAVCPVRYALACDVSPGDRKVAPDTCRCVRTSDIAVIGGHSPVGRIRGFRTRIRN